MSLWGNKDTKTVAGTVSVTNDSVDVTGSSTAFTTALKAGQTLVIAGVEYRVDSIQSNTALKLKTNYAGSTASGLTVTANEQPAYIPVADLDKVYFADRAEVSAGGDNVVSVALVQGGSGYKEVPAVAFSGGNGSGAEATATIADGVVTKVTVTNTGSSYDAAPSVFLAVPRRTILSSAVNTTDNSINYAIGHGLTTGDAVKYYKVGVTAIAGLTNATTYYAVVVDDDNFKLAATEEDALNDTPVVIDLTGTGNDDQYFDLIDETTATATAALGSGEDGTKVTHSGWVKRTVGTGGRAGRIQYETLVAMGTPAATSGDASDDLVFPDA